MGEKGGAAAAVAAITAKAKLAGLWREKVAQTDPSGENAPRYIISDRPMTEEEWIRERCGLVERMSFSRHSSRAPALLKIETCLQSCWSLKGDCPRPEA